MSKHYNSHSSRVMVDIHTLEVDELQDLYGIEINEDGTVYDLTEFKEFETLADWANYIVAIEEEENYGTVLKIGGKLLFDDEY